MTYLKLWGLFLARDKLIGLYWLHWDSARVQSLGMWGYKNNIISLEVAFPWSLLDLKEKKYSQ